MSLYDTERLYSSSVKVNAKYLNYVAIADMLYNSMFLRVGSSPALIEIAKFYKKPKKKSKKSKKS